MERRSSGYRPAARSLSATTTTQRLKGNLLLAGEHYGGERTEAIAMLAEAGITP